MRTLRAAAAALPLVVALGLGACTSAGGPATGSTAAAPTVDVATAAGVVTVSLDGRLPPDWPTDLPVPDGATPAGTGALPGGADTTRVGAYSVAQPPEEVFAFYAERAGLPVASSASSGAGDTFDGTVRIDGAQAALVTVVGDGGASTAVVVLQVDPAVTTSIGASGDPTTTATVPAPG